MADDRGEVVVIGILGDAVETLSHDARSIIAGATTIAGGRRQVDYLRRSRSDRPDAKEIVLTDDAGGFARAVAAAAREDGSRVVVLASGDPGFFGITRALGTVVDRERLRVLPSASSVSVAFARLGLPWDDAVVVSAHGRPFEDALEVLRLVGKAAVLTSPENPPAAVGKALLRFGVTPDLLAVCSRLGFADESVSHVDTQTLASGEFDPLSVVVVIGPGGLPQTGYSTAADKRDRRSLAWGLPEEAFAHRGGMVTKSEVRAVALGKLALPPSGVLWDVGAGSGSVAVECALLQPGLTVFAIESNSDDATRTQKNASDHGVAVHVIEASAPEVFDGLPHPDRVFVGGGGIEVLEAAISRLRRGGRVVATFAALDRASAAADLLGSLVQVATSRGSKLPDGGWRLEALNPVFVCWGPRDEDT